jgi:hypothetical protein
MIINGGLVKVGSLGKSTKSGEINEARANPPGGLCVDAEPDAVPVPNSDGSRRSVRYEDIMRIQEISIVR